MYFQSINQFEYNTKAYNNSNNNSSGNSNNGNPNTVSYYDSEDDETTLATAIDDLSSLLLYNTYSVNDIEAFQDKILDPTNPNIITSQNTYFMDGGIRFISLPTLGNSNLKPITPIIRIFEDWISNKLYNHNEQNSNLPILEDNIELLSEDILNLFKLKKKNLKGLSNILIKIRTGHVYSYHQLENGQPIITQDMEHFFQQFPLFIEIIIYVEPTTANHEINFLLLFENTILNPNNPYKLMDYI